MAGIATTVALADSLQPFANARRLTGAATLILLLLMACGSAAGPLDELPLDRWAKLREVERYQLQIAERYYKQQNWKAALAEYEKFVALYEKSEGASYAQLKWGLCQVQLRQANTAIKDGFQSVVDYWPDSPDAVVARFYIGRTNKDMGQVDRAKKAYHSLLQDLPQHPVAAYALGDLVDIAQTEKDFKARAEYWKRLTFDVKRSEATEQPCRQAARQYAQWCFGDGLFDEGVKALATAGSATELPAQVAAYACPALVQLAAEAPTRPQAERLAAQAVAWLRQQGPAAVSTPEQKDMLRKLLFAAADIHAAAQQDSQTAAVYEEIVRRCGDSDETLGRLAAWHEARGKFDAAYTVLRRYEKKPDGLARIAASYRRRKLWPAAIGIYRELLGVDASHAVRWTAETAATHREAGQYAEAIGVYRELLKSEPANSPQWLWQIGVTHRDAGQWKEAIGILRQCTNVPDNFMVMASCHRQLKEYREALLLYGQIGAEPQHAPWAALQIGLTWEEAGQKEEAIKALQQVCKRFPKSPQASTAHARLQDVYRISVTMGGAADE